MISDELVEDIVLIVELVVCGCAFICEGPGGNEVILNVCNRDILGILANEFLPEGVGLCEKRESVLTVFGQ